MAEEKTEAQRIVYHAFYPKRRKLAVLCVIFAILSAGGAGLISLTQRVFGERDIILWGEIDIGFVVLMVIGGLLFIAGGIGATLLLARIVNPKPLITVGLHGFFDRRRMKAPIPLDDISGLRYDPASPNLIRLYTRNPKKYENWWRWLKHHVFSLRKSSPNQFNVQMRYVRVSILDFMRCVRQIENPDFLLAYADALYSESGDEDELSDAVKAELSETLAAAGAIATEARTMVNIARWYIGEGPLPENPELTDRLLDFAAREKPAETLNWVRYFATPSSNAFNLALAREMNKALRRNGKQSLPQMALEDPEFRRVNIFENPKRPFLDRCGVILRGFLFFALIAAVIAYAIITLIEPPYLWDKITTFSALTVICLWGLYEVSRDIIQGFRDA